MYNGITLCLFTLAMIMAREVDSAEIKLAAATTEPSILELLRAGDDTTAAKLMSQLPQTTASLIEWEPCTDYEVTQGVIPVVFPMEFDSSGLSLSQCKQRCNDRTDCGGFAYRSTGVCLLYNINNAIVDEYLVPDMFFSSSIYVWYSKKCEYKAGCRYCNEYGSHVYNKKSIYDQQHMITFTWINVSGLTAEMCQNWCTLYKDCKSVEHKQYSSGGWCYLFSTTIQELINNGGGGVGGSAASTTYDRHCCPPYNP